MNKKIFLAMSRRRLSCPQVTQHLWDAIKVIRFQKQIPTLDRICRYMSRLHNVNEDEVQRQLNHCVRDGLIRHVRTVGVKGSKTGVEQDAYRLPLDDEDRDKHDWYCFECHSGGDVICCTGCHRVYHLSCVTKEDMPEDDVKHKFICAVCKMCSSQTPDFKIKKSELNHLLIFTCARLKERLPPTITDRQLQLPARSIMPTSTKSTYTTDRSGALQCRDLQHIKWVIDEEDKWRVNYLIYQPMDLLTMEDKADNNRYRSLEEFQADAQVIVHNVVIYHGVHSSLADMARQMLRDCIYDLREIKQCRDCYRVSNEKKDKYWFCQPCKPPHELVYAKQKGFPFWPAKVININGDQYDVRFFGGYHERAVIERNHIRPISVNIHSLQVKRTSTWNKACEELRRHQELMDKLRSENQNQNLKEEESSEDESESEESEVETKMAPTLARQEEVESDDPSQDEEGSISSTSKAVKMEKGGPVPEDMVSSSSQEPITKVVSTQTPPRFLKALEELSGAKAKKNNAKDTEKAVREVQEKMKREFEAEKQRAVAAAVKSLERDLERLKADHTTELEELAEKHKLHISETKKKQWCYNCELEAIYHCCWNTAYCSIECQQSHWHKEHKRLCRRKR